MSLFESLAIRDGRVEFFAEHAERLEAAARQRGWAVDSVTPGLAAAHGWFLKTYGPGPAFARLYLSAGDGGPDAPVTAPRLFLFAEPRNAALPGPCRLTVNAAPHLPFPGGLKTANYWANLEALAAARRAGADEALLFNPAGELVSACMANAFAVIDGELITPPLSTGARRGVVREWVQGRRPVVERTLDRNDVERASEWFLTSSWNGVRPVASLNGRPLGTTLGETLRAEFFAAPERSLERRG